MQTLPTPTYNKEVVAQKMGLDTLTVEMILDNFFLTLEDDLNALEAACNSGDAELIRQRAHYLKGVCANLYIEEAATMLASLEHEPLDKAHTMPQIRTYLMAIKEG